MTQKVIAVVAVLLVTAVSGQSQVDLTGTWLLQVQTSAGGGSPTFTFKQTGDALEGTYEGAFGQAKVTGSVKGNQARWSFDVDAQGTALTIVYEGTVEGDSMKGTVRLGELGDGTFTGKKK
ncbi:MAG: hypothetical protein ACRD26_13980 [Vicinamibacterales bacterium]